MYNWVFLFFWFALKKINAVLVLGCNGHKKGKFVFCKGTSNPIINLSEIEDSQYNKVVDFLDNSCDLFDYKITDLNKLSNTLNLLNKVYSVFSKNVLEDIQLYINMHKNCGLYLVLLMEEDYYE